MSHERAGIAELGERLLSDSTGRPEKLEILKLLIRIAPDPRIRPILDAAAARPANASILREIVRAYGFLGDPTTVRDLIPYLAYEDRGIVCNALKSVITLDPTQALRLAKHTIKNARPQIAWSAALLLARRCESECREFFLGLTYSVRARDRLAALVYLRTRPPEESVPVLLDMVRRETSPDVRAPLNKLLLRRIPKRDASVLEQLRSELLTRAAEIDELLSRLPDELDPSWSRPDQGRPSIPQEAAPEPPPVLSAPTGQALRADRETAPSSLPPVGTEQAAPGAAPAIVPGPSPARPLARNESSTAAPHHGLSSRAGWSVAAAVVAAAILVHAGAQPRPGAARSAPAPQACPLGNLGSRIEFDGVIVEVQKARKAVVVRKGRDITIRILCLDMDLDRLTPGKTVDVVGILRQIESGNVFLVQALSVTVS